jgi:type IV pilus biogenesis protein CpaD/CtpE
MRATITILSLVALGLSACQTATPALEPALTPTLGDAVRHNIAAMAVPPTEAEKQDTYIPQDRAQRARALKAYREGTTPVPELMSTNDD